jgi:5-methyltetrahydrofolate--homocysteine methyltransferase
MAFSVLGPRHVIRAAGFNKEIQVSEDLNSDDIVLAELDDEELVEQMWDDLYDGLAEEIAEATQILLDREWSAKRVLDDALVSGMNIVGQDFRDGILFVPEVLLAANAMKTGMAILKPILTETGAEPSGKMVIGTVKGDIHDIGKNLVGMMMEGAGFEVVDLGINIDADTYIEALTKERPDILGMSALLTTTMPYMKVVIDKMKEQGIRDNFIVMVGGAPLNEEFGQAVGADAYCRDAATAVEMAKQLVSARRLAG